MEAEYLSEYVAIRMTIVIPVPLWRLNTQHVFTRFKILKNISYVAVEGGIAPVSKIFKIQ
jgi:hypothetical protein